MNKPRFLNATQIGPWETLCILMRFQNGENAKALSRIYKVSPQTIRRWHAKFGEDTQHVHVARLAALHAQDMDEAARVVDDLKKQLDRAHAILHRLTIKCVARNVGVSLKEQEEANHEHVMSTESSRRKQERMASKRVPTSLPSSVRAPD